MLTIDLKDQVALVTGVSSGIGAGVAFMMAKAGCHVVGCARKKEDDPSVIEFKKQIKVEGRESLYIQADVTKNKELENLLSKTIERFGKLDIVISNAGINKFEGVENCSEDEWQNNLDLNLSSHWRLSKLCKPWLKKSENGTIVIMTSNHAYSSIPGCFPYNVTKTALTGLVRSMAIEWGPSVRVLGLAPGFVDTPGNDTWFNSFHDPSEQREKTIAGHPAGKIGTVEEMGAFCAFMVSNFAAFATGVTFLVDGGISAIMSNH